MIKSELISTDYDNNTDTKNPMEKLSCEEVLNLLSKFVELKLGGNLILLKKIEKHLISSIKGNCECWNNFSKMNKKKSFKDFETAI